MRFINLSIVSFNFCLEILSTLPLVMNMECFMPKLQPFGLRHLGGKSEQLYHMARTRFGEEVIGSLLQKQRIATLSELKQALGSSATMTVFRKLKALGYRTSYSPRGKYTTPANLPHS